MDAKRYRTYGRSRSVRLTDHAYRTRGTVVHVIVCCESREDYFRDGRLATHALEWCHTCANAVALKIWVCCIMPNHAHFLVEVSGCDDGKRINPISRFVQRWKSGLKAHARNNNLVVAFQKSFYDHILRPHENPATIACYIAANPVRADLCDDWQEYPYTYLNPSAL